MNITRFAIRMIAFAVMLVVLFSITVSAENNLIDPVDFESNVIDYTVTSTGSNYNDVTFPFPDYPATLKVNWDTSGIQSYFNTSYAGSYECDGFAKYAHDRFFHLVNWNRSYPSWEVNGSNNADYKGPITWSTQAQMETFFNSLSKGTFIRYISYADLTPGNGTHSVVFDRIADDGEGIIVYECNQDGNNGVGYQNYTFDLLYVHYKSILYYVEHSISNNATIVNASYHKKTCSHCNGYLQTQHTAAATYTAVSAVNHRVSYTCCGYITVSHTFDTAGRCTGCGYRTGSQVNSNDLFENE